MVAGILQLSLKQLESRRRECWIKPSATSAFEGRVARWRLKIRLRLCTTTAHAQTTLISKATHDVQTLTWTRAAMSCRNRPPTTFIRCHDFIFARIATRSGVRPASKMRLCRTTARTACLRCQRRASRAKRTDVRATASSARYAKTH